MIRYRKTREPDIIVGSQGRLFLLLCVNGYESSKNKKKEEWCYDTEAWIVHGPLAVTFR